VSDYGDSREVLVCGQCHEIKEAPACRCGPKAKHTFAGVDPTSAEAHLRSVLWDILGGRGCESVEEAARRVVRERNEHARYVGQLNEEYGYLPKPKPRCRSRESGGYQCELWEGHERPHTCDNALCQRRAERRVGS
jgi:hypothetical protein